MHRQGSDHPHDHSAPHALSRKLLLATAATLLFVIVELAAGLYANSLALIGNALHDFTDGLALILALIAVRLERRPATEVLSFGYQRAGVLAAFINAGTLVAFTLFLFYEAFHRFRDPRPVQSTPMIVTAAIGIFINAAITWSLRREGRGDVNIRSAVVHMLGDAIASAGIIVAAVLILVTGSVQWDAALSMAIGVLILWSSWGILRETVSLLLEGTPSGIDPVDVTRALASVDGVEGVHHLHIWALAPSRPALSCHLMVGDVPVKTTSEMLDRVTEMLHERYRIVHVTVQFEFAHCADDDPYCVPYTVNTER